MSDAKIDPMRGISPVWLHSRRRTAAVMLIFGLVSLAYNWYYLSGGFHFDDYIFLNLIRQDPLPYSRWLGCWSSSDVPALMGIWWFEGNGVSAFWRPIPALLIEGLFRLFGDRPFPFHLLSIFLHGLVGGTLFLLVRRITGRPLVALLAGLFFVSCEDHSMGMGWISAMTDLVCVLFVNLSLLAHAAWLDKRKPRLLVGSLAAMVVALLSKESAVVAPLVIVLMTLAMPRGRDIDLHAPFEPRKGDLVSGFTRDWTSWVPAAALLVAYLATYKLLGFGGLSSGMYIDPFTQPLRYVLHLVFHLPVMWLATLSPVPPSLAMFLPGTIVFLTLLGTLVFAVWVAGLWPMRGSALVAWSMGVYLLALLPQMSTDASERCLYFPAIGSSILLALLVVQIGPLARREFQGALSAPRFTRWVGWTALTCVLIPGVLLSAMMPFAYLPSSERLNVDSASVVHLVKERDASHLVVLNTPGLMHTIYVQPIVEYRVAEPVDLFVLSSMNGVMSVERVGDRSFVLRADRKGWLTNVFAAMLRSPKPPKPGRVYDEGLFIVTLGDMTADGRDVLSVRFDMNRPLDDPSVLFIQWNGTAFVPIDLAGLPVGTAVTLADTSDVWASMW